MGYFPALRFLPGAIAFSYFLINQLREEQSDHSAITDVWMLAHS
ncbi:hypothetical protein AVDCRST_MAG81-4997 [uncultured Synechococcales cyanobacterium]|uniref:Uncharacterized protein n=1 Tax=uncultured Synechococcales cyanobacterium TaxID=1936017 RepID=A0A6J4VWT6_9CYAN|nr:hypothetical protein AVDCRST_MAG81-4997 [uncultured Synechococcales cyanobacterium]